MPKFRPALFVLLGVQSVTMVPIFVSLFVDSAHQMPLCLASFLFDATGMFWLVLIFVRTPSLSKYMPAMNLEHNTERLGLLTIIVLGEMVVGLLWSADKPYLSRSYVATILGLLIVIVFHWITYDLDGGSHLTHASRRSALLGVTWQTLHLPFHACLVAAGAAMSDLVQRAGGRDPHYSYKTVSDAVTPRDARYV